MRTQITGELERRADLEQAGHLWQSATSFPALLYRFKLLPVPRLDFVNHAITDLCGHLPGDCHITADQIARFVHEDDIALCKAMFRGDSSVFESPLRIRVTHKDGRTVWTEHRLAPIYDEAENLTAIEGIALDITGQHELEEELRVNAARLQEAQRIARIGNWEWDIPANHVWWSDEVYRIFGLRKGAFSESYESFLARVHPEDRQEVEAVVAKAILEHEPYAIDHRILLPDGTEKTVHEQAELTCDKNGHAIRMAGTVHDITERVATERALAASENRMAAILNSIPDMIFRLNRDGVFLDFRGPENAPLWCPPDRFLGRKVGDVFDSEYADRSLAFVRQALESGEMQTWEYDTELANELRSFEARYVRSQEDEVVVVVRDVTETRQAIKKIEALKERLLRENRRLRQESRVTRQVDPIVGEHEALKKCIHLAENVAPTDVPVLILGETGTGKELLARAIYNLSERRDKPFVSVHCPALPANLIESELFGHERGAFTDAHARRTGRFEAADNGTLFLDEIGDLPLELQSKLLRVLQEGQFERLGSSQTRRVDVRVIAATNRDLEIAVHRGEFRADLYYRLSAFPIRLPALRDRKEDIVLLAEHFMRKHAARLGKDVSTIPPEMIQFLEEHPWPGNARELEGCIVRALISTKGRVLRLPEAAIDISSSQDGGQPDQGLSTLREAERSHILKALKQTHWVITGRKGAARLLGIPASTLRSKMARLGLARPLDHK